MSASIQTVAKTGRVTAVFFITQELVPVDKPLLPDAMVDKFGLTLRG